MALVHTIGTSIQDYSGNKKSMAIYVPASLSLTDVQTQMNSFLPAIDAAIDGKIIDAAVTIALSLPVGLKTAADNGNTVHEGALLRYAAASTAFEFGLYVPSWCNSGFTGDTPVTTGVWATAEGAPIIFASDRNANALNAYLGGRRAFRK